MPRCTTPISGRRGSVGKQELTITSPLVTHYLLTLTTAVLSTVGFIAALLPALSCDFLHVSLNESVPPMAASGIVYTNNTAEGWYYNELLEKQVDHAYSVGVFCSSSLVEDGNNSRITVSKAFLITSLLLGGFLLNTTWLLSTILSTTERLWNTISFTSGLAFLCELPVFFILDSPPCNQADFTCSLSKGSFGLFCSMVCYLILALMTQWKEAPDWKEEYELWKLRRRNYVDRASGNADGRDVEMGMANVKQVDAIKQTRQRQMDHVNVTPSAPEDQSSAITTPPPPPPKTEKISPSTARQLKKRLAKQTRMSETSNFVGKYIDIEPEPITPEHRTSARNISPISHFSDRDNSSAVETEEYVDKSTEISQETQESYVNLINQELQKSLEMQKMQRMLQKQRELVEEEKDWEQHSRQRELGMQPTEEEEEEREGEPHQLDQQQEQKPPKQLKLHGSDEISHLSFPSLLDYHDVDVNTKTFEQAPFGKDSFDPVFHKDMPDLSSIIVSIDEDDFAPIKPVVQKAVMAPPKQFARVSAMPVLQEPLRDQPESKLQRHAKNLPKPVMKKSVSAPVQPAVNEPVRPIDDISVSKSVRSVSTLSTRGLLAKQSMKSIFRKLELPGKENSSKTHGINDGKEKIEEQWMLEETSLGRSNSDDLLFLVERNREDGASMNSRRSKVTVLSWVNRCNSPEKRTKSGQNRQRGKAVAPNLTPPARHDNKGRVVSPCNDDGDLFYNKGLYMPSEVVAVGNNGRVNGSAIISPEKDDPGVEMYPSDASMSTLSLPTGSDHYTSESDNDRRSKSARRDYFRGSGVSHGTDSGTSESEMSLIIAGVQRINRKTCGKPTPLNKRRRRKKRSSNSGYSTFSDYSSQSGSLLDEVIDEEGELNESGEQVPAVIEASPMKSPKKKSKSPPKKSKNSSRSAQYASLSDAEHSGYESGYANPSDLSDNDSKRAGSRHLSDNDESYSSRAARARRNRLLSIRQIHVEPDLDYLAPSESGHASDESGYKSASNSRYSGKSSREGSRSKSRRRQTAYSDTVPLISKHNVREDEFVNLSRRGTMSWQARNSRMSRLRMQRQTSDPIVRDLSGVVACNSDEGSI